MQKTDTLYTAYVEVLKEELLPAMGCTEPIAIAYAAAAARRILNELPCEVCVTASGNIIKNVEKRFCAEHRWSARHPCGGCGGDHSRT